MNALSKLLGAFILISPSLTNAQNLTLDSAFKLARENYPVIKQKDLIRQTQDLNIENLNKGFYPQLTLNGQGSYQSEVTKVEIPFPGMKINPLSKDQYKLTADLNQLLFDGGAIKEQKILQQLNATTEEEKVEVELYKLRDRVNQLYFGILLLDEQLVQVKLAKADLENGIKKSEAQVKNGIALRSALNTLKAESLKSDQHIIELSAAREGLVNSLSVFIGQQLPQNILLIQPSAPAPANEINRPELSLFTAQSSLIDHQRKLLKVKNLPKAAAFLQGGYGRPGLNMLKNEFDWFYITGLRLNWPLSGLYTYKNDKKLIDISKRTVELQKETFLLNTNTQLTQQQSEISKYEKLAATDIQIIELRKSIKEAALAQFENGVITSSDYVREVNAEDQARLALITHKLQLLLAQINYQTIKGK
jgi:outer membrane protein TolC